jgi:hypothetical protein
MRSVLLRRRVPNLVVEVRSEVVVVVDGRRARAAGADGALGPPRAAGVGDADSQSRRRARARAVQGTILNGASRRWDGREEAARGGVRTADDDERGQRTRATSVDGLMDEPLGH